MSSCRAGKQQGIKGGGGYGSTSREKGGRYGGLRGSSLLLVLVPLALLRCLLKLTHTEHRRVTSPASHPCLKSDQRPERQPANASPISYT